MKPNPLSHSLFVSLVVAALFTTAATATPAPPTRTGPSPMGRAGEVRGWRVAVFPVEAAGADTAPALLPSFDNFVKLVTDGQAGVVRGVYVPGVLALRVRQQPAGNPGYVSTNATSATQFGMAANQGVIGLLAHNYLAGRSFFNLAAGQEVRIVYGDGSVKYYAISAVYQYQALAPTNPSGNFVDLSTGARTSASNVFGRMYSGSDHVTFQTCIQRGKETSWGRLFVVATPLQPAP